MPCSDGRYDYQEDPETKRRLDLATRLLCSLCRRITKSGKDTLIYEDDELAQWWGKHQAEDRLREASEAAERKKQEIIEQALAKLSPKERKLLAPVVSQLLSRDKPIQYEKSHGLLDKP